MFEKSADVSTCGSIKPNITFWQINKTNKQNEPSKNQIEQVFAHLIRYRVNFITATFFKIR